MFRKWLERASRWQLILCAIAFMAVVFLCDVGFDFLMMSFDSSRRELLFISDALTSIIAGGLMLGVLLIQRSRQIETHERMQVISEMNHHVRNALQVISYWGVQERGREQLRFIEDAMDRIEWALTDVLPRGVANERKGPQLVRDRDPKQRAASKQ